MSELNQNQNSKQPDRPDAVWKLYFTMEFYPLHNCLQDFYRIFALKVQKRFEKKAVKLGSFLQSTLWKINLRILWNHTMKKCQVRHGQFHSIIFLEIFSFESSY